MTAIKQVAITSQAHGTGLEEYLEKGEKILGRDSQNIIREKNWAQEMEQTRSAYGHDKPIRPGVKNTTMFHQILAFNPDEIDLNGGRLMATDCMTYAREYVTERYPNQEAFWVLHQEHSKNDGTARYAVHIALNRTNLETGKRLNDGRGRTAAIERANTVKDLDSKYGLEQMRPGERNVQSHTRQVTRAESELLERGEASWKVALATEISSTLSKSHVVDFQSLAQDLETQGISLNYTRSKRELTFTDKDGHKVRGSSLGQTECDRKTIEKHLAANAERATTQAKPEINRDEYDSLSVRERIAYHKEQQARERPSFQDRVAEAKRRADETSKTASETRSKPSRSRSRDWER